MFYRASYITLNLIIIFYSTDGDNQLMKNDKHFGNDLQMCLENFDIHTNKIIKTVDSREMGGKFLRDIDVESREECLKYCCETENCDVFIFEEKKPGSCYLFECGPLHNFKCKFTSHANYSSAVRTNYNSLNPVLDPEIRISQQEHELKSLRKQVDPSVEYKVTEPSIKPIVTYPPKSLLTTLTIVNQGPICSRNQYECRSSGECIAIYNVCDGIPQCNDGSDEAADLVCPTEKPTPLPPLIMQRPLLPADIIRYQQMIDQQKQNPVLYMPRAEDNSRISWESHPPPQQIPPQSNLLYPIQMEVPLLHKNTGPQYKWNYQPVYEQNKDNYNGQNLLNSQKNIIPYEGEQSHSFENKGSNTMDEIQTNTLKQPYYSNYAPTNSELGKKDEFKSSEIVIQNNERKEIVQPVIREDKNTVTICNNITEEENNQMIKPSAQDDKQLIKKLEKHQNNEDDLKRQKSSTSKNDSLSYKQTTNKKQAYDTVRISLENRVKDNKSNNVIVEHLQLAIDNEILKPRGAVISLTLGLIATAITAALIACRLRVVRRRSRRGHGPYAHDADYLVNGMYL